MSRFTYYESLKALAREVRTEHGLNSPRVLRSDLRRIYRTYGIRIDLWRHRFKQLRGAYFNDELGPSVMLNHSLPPEPLIFTMGHELKHHLTDRDLGLSYCDVSNQKDQVEIGAEVFAAELIFPEGDFIARLEEMEVARGACTPEVIVRLKRESATTLSYAGLVKRAEYLDFVPRGACARVKWKKLEEQLYGEPIYKQLIRSRKAVPLSPGLP